MIVHRFIKFNRVDLFLTRIAREIDLHKVKSGLSAESEQAMLARSAYFGTVMESFVSTFEAGS